MKHYSLHNRCRDDGVVQQPPLPQQTFFQHLHIMDPRAVDPLLKHTPDAVVHRIQIWRIRWQHLRRDKLWRLSLQHGDSVTCTMCWCPILLKNVVIPENRADIRQICCVLFVSSILVSVNVIDINMCTVLILCEMCYFCIWHFHTVW